MQHCQPKYPCNSTAQSPRSTRSSDLTRACPPLNHLNFSNRFIYHIALWIWSDILLNSENSPFLYPSRHLSTIISLKLFYFYPSHISLFIQNPSCTYSRNLTLIIHPLCCLPIRLFLRTTHCNSSTVASLSETLVTGFWSSHGKIGQTILLDAAIVNKLVPYVRLAFK